MGKRGYDGQQAPGREGATYGAALASGQFRAVFAAAGLSVCGNVVADVVQTVLIYDRTRSPLLASLAFSLGFLPYLVTGTVLSGVADRVPPRRLLVTGYLGAAALMVVMTLPGLSVGELLVLVTLTGFATGLGGASKGVVVRATVSRAAYVPAQSLMRISSQVAQVAANPVGGFLIVLASARGTFLVAAAIMLAAAAIARFGLGPRTGVAPRALAAQPASPDVPGGTGPAVEDPVTVVNAPAGQAAPQRGLLGDSLSGMRAVLALPALRRLMLLGWVIPMFSVAPESLAAAYVGHHGGSPTLVGWWLTALPVGIVAGDLLGVWLLRPALQRRLVGFAAIASFLPYLVFFASPPVWACLPLLVGSGMCSLYSLGLDARVRDAAPDGLFARMMAMNNAGLLTIQAIGFSLAGLIGGLAGPGLAVGIAGVAGIAGTALLWPGPGRREAAKER